MNVDTRCKSYNDLIFSVDSIMIIILRYYNFLRDKMNDEWLHLSVYIILKKGSNYGDWDFLFVSLGDITLLIEVYSKRKEFAYQRANSSL